MESCSCNGLHCLPFFLFFAWIQWYGLHAGYMKSVRYRFLFYGMVRYNVNCRVCGGRFPIRVHFEFLVFPQYCQIEVVYGVLFFVSRVEF